MHNCTLYYTAHSDLAKNCTSDFTSPAFHSHFHFPNCVRLSLLIQFHFNVFHVAISFNLHCTSIKVVQFLTVIRWIIQDRFQSMHIRLKLGSFPTADYIQLNTCSFWFDRAGDWTALEVREVQKPSFQLFVRGFHQTPCCIATQIECDRKIVSFGQVWSSQLWVNILWPEKF